MQGDVVCSYKASFEAAKYCKEKGLSANSLQSCQNKAWAHLTKNNKTDHDVKKECHKMHLNSTDVIWHCIAARTIEIKVWCQEPLDENNQRWEITDYKSNSEDDSKPTWDSKQGKLSVEQCRDKVTETTAIAGWQTGELVGHLQDAGETITQWLGDLQQTLDAILVTGLLFTVILSLVWLYFMRVAPKAISWTFIVLALLSIFILMLFFFEKAGLLGMEAKLLGLKTKLQKQTYISVDMMPTAVPAIAAEDKSNHELYKWGGIVTACIFGIATVVTVLVRDKISLAIQVMAEASKAIRDLPLLIFYPLFNFVAIILLVLHWIFVGGLIMTSGEIINSAGEDLAEKTRQGLGKVPAGEYTPNFIKDVNTSNLNWEPFKEDDGMKWSMAFHTVCMMWTYGTLIALGYYVIARAVSQWYFKEGKYIAAVRNRTVKVDESKLCNLGCCKVNCEEQKETPVVDAFLSAWKYHMGSLLFGGFVTTLCKLLIVFFGLLHKFSERIEGVGAGNKFLDLVKKCVATCLSWFNKFVKFISRNAYIYIAMYSDQSFCQASMESFKLIKENIVEIWVVDAISDFIMFVGKLFIVFFNGWIAFLWVAGHENKPSSIFLPVLMTCVLTYFIASGIMQVYEMTIDTIILCYLEDKLKNKGGPYNMSPALKKAMQVETTDPFNMKPSESFYFSNDVSRNGQVSLGIGWSCEQVEVEGAANKVDVDIDASLLCFDKDGNIKDWIGYWRDQSSGQLKRKHKSGGRLFEWVGGDKRVSPLKPGDISHSGDKTKGSLTENGESIDEVVTVDLAALDRADIDVVAFCMFVFKGGDFQTVNHVYMHGQEHQRLGAGLGQQVCRFSFSPVGEEKRKSGMLFAKLRRNVVGGSDGVERKAFWELEATGQFTTGRTVTTENMIDITKYCFPSEEKRKSLGLLQGVKNGVGAGIAVMAMQ